jgi:pimeloyl-ACP methyl ester carboxylesterase
MLCVETRLKVEIDEGAMAGLKWTPQGFDGQSPALVFLHANGFCASTYRALLSGLADQTGKCVAALDLRGHGRSRLPDNPDDQDNWYRHARDVVQALEFLAPEGTVLAGHSMGGTTALLAAARARQLIKGLCLFDPVLAPATFYLYARMPWVFDNWRKNFPMARAASKRRAVFPSREEAANAYQGRGAFKSWPLQTIVDYCDDGFTDLPEGGVTLSCTPAFEAACFAGQRHNPYAALRKVACPTRLLRAGRNSTTIALMTKKLEKHGVKVETLLDTNHFFPMEQPDLCQAAMAEIIKQGQTGKV